MTRSKKLLSLLVALLVVSVAAYAAFQWNVDESEEEEEQDIIFSLSSEDVTELSWTYDGETVTFTQEDGAWTYEADSAFPLDDSILTSMVSALSEISAAKTIDSPEDLADYGLEEPACSVTVTADGTTTTLDMGDESTLDGDLYLSLGDGNVYLVDSSLLSSFSYGLYDLVQEETIPEMDEITSVTVQTGSNTLELDYLEESGLAYSDDYVWFQATDSGYVTLDTELTDDFVSQITGLSWSSCVNYNASEEELESYSLVDPVAVVTVNYISSVEDEDGETQEQAETFVLELGQYTGDGCYARISGSNMVYQIDGTVVDTLLYTSADSLLPDDILCMDWDTVTAVDITIGSETYYLEKTVQEVESEDEDSTETEEETVWYLDGVEIDPESTLDQLNDLASSETIESQTPELSAAISFVFHRNTENFQTVELTFYQYDSSSYLVSLNGEARLLVSRDDLDTVLDAFDTLLNGSDDEEESTDTEAEEAAEEEVTEE